MRMQYGLSFGLTGFRYVYNTSRKNIRSLVKEIAVLPDEEQNEEDGNGKQVIDLFYLSPSEYEVHLKQCARKGLQDECLNKGHKIHTGITMKGHDLSVFIMNHLIHMYGKCRAMEDAWSLFHGMNQKNIFSWNIMIGLNQHHGKEAYHIFLQMLMEGFAPDKPD